MINPKWLKWKMKSKMINLVDIILSYGLYYITWYYINVEDNIMRSNIASQKIRLWCNINGDLLVAGPLTKQYTITHLDANDYAVDKE